MRLNSLLRNSTVNFVLHPLIRVPGPKLVNLFSSSTQLSMKFQLLIKTKIPIRDEVSCFKSLRYQSAVAQW